LWRLVAVFLLVAACSGRITVDEALPTSPLFLRIDATVGKSFTAQARSATAEQILAHAEIGKISVGRFDQAFDAMFTATVPLPASPPWQQTDVSGLDGVIQLEEAIGDISVGNDSNTPDVVGVSYRACLYRTDATTVQCWTAAATQVHQRRPFECLPDLRPCIKRQLEIAVRDAVAKFMIQVEADPAVGHWSKRVAEKEESR
jgi:hypothetical protein